MYSLTNAEPAGFRSKDCWDCLPFGVLVNGLSETSLLVSLRNSSLLVGVTLVLGEVALILEGDVLDGERY